MLRFHFELPFIRMYKVVFLHFLQTEIWQRSAGGWGGFGKIIIFLNLVFSSCSKYSSGEYALRSNAVSRLSREGY